MFSVWCIYHLKLDLHSNTLDMACPLNDGCVMITHDLKSSWCEYLRCQLATQNTVLGFEHCDVTNTMNSLYQNVAPVRLQAKKLASHDACTCKRTMKKQCIQDMLALTMAALVHFGAWNNMVPGLVWLGETIGAFEEMAMCCHSKPCVVCALHIQEAGPTSVCIWGANSSCHMYFSPSTCIIHSH